MRRGSQAKSVLSMGLMVGLLASCAMVSCTSPGEPFAYKDVKFSVAPAATPAQPATTHAVTINFTIRNTWNNDLVDVPWEMRLNADPTDPLSGAVVTTGTASIAAYSSTNQSFALGTLAKGSYTYAVILDPAHVIAEENEGNNIGQVTLLVADQDISFGTPAPTITVDAGAGTPPTRPLTATFAIQHTVNTTAPAPPAVAIDVPYAVSLNGTPVVPTAASTASPANVNPAGTNPLTITLSLPATGSAGSFPYVITLSPAVGDDNNTTNNTVTVVVTVPASG